MSIASSNLFELIKIFEFASGLNINFSNSEILGVHISEADLDWLTLNFGCR